MLGPISSLTILLATAAAVLADSTLWPPPGTTPTHGGGGRGGGMSLPYFTPTNTATSPPDESSSPSAITTATITTTTTTAAAAPADAYTLTSESAAAAATECVRACLGNDTLALWLGSGRTGVTVGCARPPLELSNACACVSAPRSAALAAVTGCVSLGCGHDGAWVTSSSAWVSSATSLFSSYCGAHGGGGGGSSDNSDSGSDSTAGVTSKRSATPGWSDAVTTGPTTLTNLTVSATITESGGGQGLPTDLTSVSLTSTDAATTASSSSGAVARMARPRVELLGSVMAALLPVVLA